LALLTRLPAPAQGWSRLQAVSGQRIGNCGNGGTKGELFQIQYVFQASKRTEFDVGYVYLKNDSNARYSLGGFTQPSSGENQQAFAVSMKTTF
jgi:predicted porin